MEARRNLETVYKRRLDEVEGRRFQAELHLQILKQYIALCTSGTVPAEVERQIDVLQKEFFRQLVLLLQQSGTHCNTDIWTDSLHIAKSELDQLYFNPKILRINELGNVLSQELKSNLEPSHENRCVNVDVDNLQKICRSLRSIIASLFPQINVAVKHDPAMEMYTLEFKDQNGRMFLLKEPYETAMSIFEHRAPFSTTVDDVVALLFISKSLAQSAGGDMVFTDDRLTVSVPIEIVDDERCKQHDESPVPLPAPVSSPAAPVPSPAAPVPSPAPIPSPAPVPSLAAPVPSPAAPVPSPAAPVPSPVAPVPSPAAPVPSPPMETSKSLEGKTLNILMAEDEAISRKMFKRFWNEKGHNVFLAGDGMEAFELYKKQRYSIVFLDVEMPFKNGIETAKAIRAYEKEKNLPTTPIIGVSGWTTKQYREQALASGMNEFISKGQGYQFRDIYKIVVDYCGS